MTLIKATTLALGLAGAFGLGFLTSAQLTSRVAPDAMDVVATGPADAERPPAARPARTAAAVLEETIRAIPATEPELHKRLKPVLNAYTNVSTAARGFRDGEQFAAVAHAARNTGAPFQVLKHLVLEKGLTLAAAIALARPDIDAKVEAERARVMARADIAAIAA